MFYLYIYIITFRCKGLILLETYTALGDDQLAKTLPEFLQIEREVTGNPDYSMFNLSLKEEWTDTKHFCRSLLNGKYFSYFLTNSLIFLINYQLKELLTLESIFFVQIHMPNIYK